jgi:hypothetical protein
MVAVQAPVLSPKLLSSTPRKSSPETPAGTVNCRFVPAANGVPAAPILPISELHGRPGPGESAGLAQPARPAGETLQFWVDGQPPVQ